MCKKRIIGLTGGIATGKSTVLKEFKNCGATVFDCDKLSRDAVKPGSKASLKIKKTFGAKVFKKNGDLNRSLLGSIVFKDPAKRKKLEDIIHPPVKKDLKEKVGKVSEGLVVVDVPLLFEAGWKNLFEKIVVVWSPKKIQHRRLKEHRRYGAKESERIIRSQWSIDKKKNLADFVIDNSASISDTKKQVRQLYHILREKRRENLLTKISHIV